MSALRAAWARLTALFRRDALDAEFDEELAAHVDLATDEFVRQGLPPDEARRRALARLGGVETSKHVHRETRGLPSLDGLLQDIRYAARSLRRSPGFTLTATLTLAVGIGINTAVFSITNGTLFKGFPHVRDNDRLLYVTTNKGALYYPDFERWRDEARSFTGLGLVRGVFKTLVTDDGAIETLYGTEVTADTFGVLGVAPFLGRHFTAADTQPGAPPVAMLRYDLWQSRFGGDPRVVGRSVQMDGVPTMVVGVMPEGFSFPADQRLWMPLIPTNAALRRETYYAVYAVGRVADDASVATVRAEIETIGQRLAADYPRTNRDLVPVVKTFTEWFIGPRAVLLYQSMWGAVAFVLLIAAANVANLLLARGMGRSREMSLRLALGASRWRIVRYGLIESAMLSVLGSVVGWWLASMAVHAYVSTLVLGNATRILSYDIDARVLMYLTAITVITALLTGLGAAVRSIGEDINSALKSGGRGLLGERQGQRIARLLIGGEISLAIVLLAGASVMMRTFISTSTADIGVDEQNVLTLSIYLPPERYPTSDTQTAFYRDIDARLRAVPGVAVVGMGVTTPTGNVPLVSYDLPDGAETVGAEQPLVATLTIHGDYFAALGTGVHAGRTFDSRDDASSEPAVIVNRRFANRHWPGGDALGKRIRLRFDASAPDAWRTIVGVVPDIVQNDPTGREASPLVYIPLLQRPRNNMFVLARTLVAPGTLASAFRREVHALDPALPVPALMPLTERFAQARSPERNVTGLFLLFAATGLLMASIGLAGITAHFVSRRTQEIGVRTAIGATSVDILALVLGHTALPVTVGWVVGIVAALALGRSLAPAVALSSSVDATILIVASMALLVGVLLGCFIPARRAMRVDPVVALRHE
ncbi:MAG: ABC transporter permease [Acidobacteria bacterium]|nr:ABC transporter permease [Acidobacteriota bacterium]